MAVYIKNICVGVKNTENNRAVARNTENNRAVARNTENIRVKVYTEIDRAVAKNTENIRADTEASRQYFTWCILEDHRNGREQLNRRITPEEIHRAARSCTKEIVYDAGCKNDLDLLQYAIAHGASWKDALAVFVVAAWKGNADILEVFRSEFGVVEADIRREKYNGVPILPVALYYAASAGHLEVIRILRESYNATGEDALAKIPHSQPVADAIFYGRDKVLEEFRLGYKMTGQDIENHCSFALKYKMTDEVRAELARW